MSKSLVLQHTLSLLGAKVRVLHKVELVYGVGYRPGRNSFVGTGMSRLDIHVAMQRHRVGRSVV